MELGASRKRRSQLENQAPPPVAVMVFANVTSGKSFDETRLVLLRALMEMAAPVSMPCISVAQHALLVSLPVCALGAVFACLCALGLVPWVVPLRCSALGVCLFLHTFLLRQIVSQRTAASSKL